MAFFVFLHKIAYFILKKQKYKQQSRVHVFAMQNSTTAALVRKVLYETKALNAEQKQQVLDIADAMREDDETVPVVTKPVIATTLSTEQQEMLTLVCFEAATLETARTNSLEMAFGAQ